MKSSNIILFLIIILIIKCTAMTMQDKLKLYACVTLAKEKLEKNQNFEIDNLLDLMLQKTEYDSQSLLYNHLESMLILNCYNAINLNQLSALNDKSKGKKSKEKQGEALMKFNEIKAIFEQDNADKIKKVFDEIEEFKKFVDDENLEEPSFNDPSANLGLLGFQFNEMPKSTKQIAGIVMLSIILGTLGLIIYKMLKKPEKAKKKNTKKNK